jgi:hypothetical protein
MGPMPPRFPRCLAKENAEKANGKILKGFRLYLSGADQQITQVASWHQIQDAETFREPPIYP